MTLAAGAAIADADWHDQQGTERHAPFSPFRDRTLRTGRRAHRGREPTNGAHRRRDRTGTPQDRHRGPTGGQTEWRGRAVTYGALVA
jgi:hypothetical protein